MSTQRKEKLVGVVVSMPTFCDEEYRLLEDRQRRHIRWLIERGIRTGSGVIMGAGGLGEGYFLKDEEFRTIVDLLAEEAEGQVPTMAGIFDLSARTAAQKARYAAEAGIDFVQLAPPHYMVPSDEEVFGHFRWVNDAADIGIMAYNIPWAMPRPGYELSPELLERLSELDHVEGVKWSSYDINHFCRTLRLFADRFHFIDNQTTFSLGARMGMKGFIDFLANVAPRLSLKFWELWREKRFDEYDALYMKLRFDPFIGTRTPEQQTWVGVGEGPTAKLTMKLLGLDCGPPFPAQASPPEGYLQGVRRAIEESGILEWVEAT